MRGIGMLARATNKGNSPIKAGSSSAAGEITTQSSHDSDTSKGDEKGEKKVRPPENALVKQLHKTNGKYLWRNRAVRNMLLEPEVIHMTCMYQELFETLYNCYRGHAQDTSNDTQVNQYPHMQLDDFLALCHDLELIPAFGTSFTFEN